MTQNPAEIEFPCRFPIKVMGRGDAAFETAVMDIVKKHLPQLPDSAMSRRDSRQGNYTALTFVIEAQSRAQLDAIYLDLTACEHVLMAL